MRHFLLAAAIIAISGPAAAAPKVLHDLMAYRAPATFNVAGFELGMSPDQALKNARDKGFSKPTVYTTAPYEALVIRGLNTRLGTRQKTDFPQVPYLMQIAGNGGGYTLDFSQTADGPKLHSITFNAGRGGLTENEYFAALTAKYGKPTAYSLAYGRVQAAWCTPGEQSCTEHKAANNLPALMVGVTESSGSVRLSLSYEAGRKLDKALDAEIARRAAAAPNKPGF